MPNNERVTTIATQEADKHNAGLSKGNPFQRSEREVDEAVRNGSLSPSEAKAAFEKGLEVAGQRVLKSDSN